MESNNKKVMREALEEFVEYSELVCRMRMFRRDRLVEITTKAKAALAAPARNCDVGTAEEQFKRYLAFCHCESRGCRHCPANKTMVGGTWNCDLVWAQMPYKEGGKE